MPSGPSPARRRRVAITGVGVVSPLGNSLAELHAALEAGRSGITRLPDSVAGTTGIQVAASIAWDPAAHFSAGEAANLDRVVQFALVSASQALADARLELADVGRDRIGVHWGTGMGGATTVESALERIYGKNDWRARPLTVVMAMNNAAAANVALRHDLRGPFANFSTACSSSAMALGEAMRTIAESRADAIVAGGAEALLTPGTLSAWYALRTMAPADAADPRASCKPFDRRRTGLVLGEGAAAFVLEEASRAQSRGARIYGYLTGYGNTCDAAHLSRPDREGQARAMRAALEEAGLPPKAIGYVNAHGTATAVGDVVESQALGDVFGPQAVRVSSTKSMHGHLLGAAGALEMAGALLALDRGIVPPTAHLQEPDPACALLHVPRVAERVEPPQAIMSNSFAFGGSNVVLVVERA